MTVKDALVLISYEETAADVLVVRIKLKVSSHVKSSNSKIKSTKVDINGSCS